VALLLVVVVLAIVTGLAGAAWVIALAEERIGRNQIRQRHAFAAAEAGVYQVVAGWNTATYNALPIDGETRFSGRLINGTGTFEGTLRRLSRLLFVVTAEGRAVGSAATSRLGLTLRLDPLPIEPSGAVTLRGPTSIEQSALISGHDAPPTGWVCPAPNSPVAALHIHPQDAAAQLVSCPANQCLLGNPPILEDSTVTLSRMTTFAKLGFADLQGLANHVVAGGVVRPLPRTEGATCITAAPDNWGDPYDGDGPCVEYVPLIYATGNLEVVGGRGQGTLVVAGDLTVSGGFEFAGLVLVQGAFRSRGIGNRLVGSVMVANTGLVRNMVGGATTVRYSSCALDRAKIGAGTASALRTRGWFQAY
jgi:hypothetical protein